MDRKNPQPDGDALTRRLQQEAESRRPGFDAELHGRIIQTLRRQVSPAPRPAVFQWRSAVMVAAAVAIVVATAVALSSLSQSHVSGRQYALRYADRQTLWESLNPVVWLTEQGDRNRPDPDDAFGAVWRHIAIEEDAELALKLIEGFAMRLVLAPDS